MKKNSTLKIQSCQLRRILPLGPRLSLDITLLWSTPSLRWWEEEGSLLCPGFNETYIKHVVQCSEHGRYPTNSYHLTVTCNCIAHKQIQKS